MPFTGFRFIIVEKNEFFAKDMEAGLRDACPNAAIVRVSRAEDAASLPPDPATRTIIITGDRLSVIDRSGLSDFADRCGALMVVRPGFDTESEVLARGFEILGVPFTDAALHDFAERVTQNQAA